MTSANNPSTRASNLVPLYADQIAGKIILITGISPGSLGESFVRQVAIAGPATFVLAGRSPSKLRSVVDYLTAYHPNITTKSLELDLQSFANIRKAAEIVNLWSDVPYIDLLVNNAGVMAVPFGLTVDGFETHFQTNHLGHFLFMNLIMCKVLDSNAPRIINISSMGHRQGIIRWADYNYSDGKLYDKMSAYGQSKTANALTSVALAEKLGKRGLLSFSVCPGSVGTNLASHERDNLAGLIAEYQAADARVGTSWMFGKLFYKDLDQGVATHVFASFDQELAGHNGAYLNHSRIADPYAEEVFPWATDKVWADMLWKLSEKLVGQKFKY